MNKPIIFIGDSITLGLEVSEIGQHAINLGIGGNTTTGLLYRMIYVPWRDENIVVLTIGINDLTYGISDATTMSNYESILNNMSKGFLVFVNSVLPVDDHKVPSSIKNRTNNKNIDELNEKIKTLCANRDNCHYIDNRDLFLNIKDAYMPDGIHLTPAGYEVWTNSLKAALGNDVRKSIRPK